MFRQLNRKVYICKHLYYLYTMTEVTISTRIPKDLEKELKEFIDKEKLDRSIAVRKLLASGLQKWREDTALKLLEEGKVTFSKASKIAGINLWDFSERLKASKIVWVNIKPDDLRRELHKL